MNTIQNQLFTIELSTPEPIVNEKGKTKLPATLLETNEFGWLLSEAAGPDRNISIHSVSVWDGMDPQLPQIALVYAPYKGLSLDKTSAIFVDERKIVFNDGKDIYLWNLEIDHQAKVTCQLIHRHLRKNNAELFEYCQKFTD